MLKTSSKSEVVGQVLPDAEGAQFGSSRSLIESKDRSLKRGTFVVLGEDSTEYFVGEVVDGPYYSSGDTEIIVYMVELSASIRDGTPSSVLTRPPPGSIVRVMPQKDIQKFLGIIGVLKLGRLPTQKNVEVGLNPAILSRHIGIFGTTGGGKSNTIQVLMEEAVQNGFAVIIFDVEGEYVFMDKPTDQLVKLLKDFHEQPKGVEDLKVYVPAPSTSRREDVIKFSVSFTGTDKEVFSEVAELTRMEQLYFLDVIDKVEQIAPAFRKVNLEAVIERTKSRLDAQADNPLMPMFIAEAHTSMYSKLALIRDLGLVDVDKTTVEPDQIVKPGRVSVVDLSDADDYVRNLVLASSLNSLFKYKVANPETANLLIVIEEAHTFISKYKRERMLATLLMLIELARRGRKRGVCLGLVTQQPAHLPPEILELCNTRIMHRMSSTPNIQSLKESTGNVIDTLWDMLPSLGSGEAIIASPKYYRAMAIKVRPVRSMRIATE